jgi:excisionase family DNA binding protein
MDLEGAAAVLGVHYQTAYRLVRTGVLPAVKVGVGYELDPQDVEALRRQRWSRRLPTDERLIPWQEEQEEFLRSLLCGGDSAARGQLLRIQGLGAPPVEVCEQVVAPVIRRLDASGSAGRVLPAEVGAATRLCERLVGGISAPMRGRPRGLAVVASPVGERHRLPSLMATAALRGNRWRVQHLGSGVPARDLVEFAEETQPEIVVLSVTVWDESAEEFCASVSSCTGVPVVAGGSGESLADLFERVDDAIAGGRGRPVRVLS